MYIGNIMLLILNLPLIGIFVRLLYIPSGILYPLIIVISAIGGYAINGSLIDLYLILFFGVVGYVFGKIDIPVAPLVLSLVLGGMMEQSFRQAMTISGGDPKIFFNSVITVSLVVLSVVSIIAPFILARFKAFKNAQIVEAD
jgi:putative tricarboxylic transport membrane protein